MKSFLFLILLLLLSAAEVDAARYWVSPSGGAASCAAASGTIDPEQYRTIAQGVLCMSPGDTLVLKIGDYGSQSVYGMPSGVSTSNRTIIMSEDAPGQVVVRSLGPLSNCAGDVTLDNVHFLGNASRNFVVDPNYVAGCGEIAVVVRGNGHRLENLEITRAASMGIFQGLGNNNAYINLHVHHNGFGVAQAGCDIDEPSPNPGLCHNLYLSEGDNNLIDGGKWHDAEGWNIHVCCSAPTNVTIRNARVYRSGRFSTSPGIGFGVGSLPAGTRHLVYNNLIYENNGRGIHIATNRVEVYNNTIYGNLEAGIGDSPENANSTGVIVRNNISSNNYLCTSSGDPNCSGAVTQSNNILASSSLFAEVSTGDFRLCIGVGEPHPDCTAAASLAIDQGTSLASFFTTDFVGTTRPFGAGWDIGAYEAGDEGDPAPDPIYVVKISCDNRVDDQSGQGNNGTLTNGATYNATGKYNQACQFDGNNDFVSIADANELDMTTAFTIAAWVKADPMTSLAYIVSKGNYFLGGYSNSICGAGGVFGGYDQGGSLQQACTSTPLTTDWTHLAITHDSTTSTGLRLFRNGVQVATATGGATLSAGTELMRIGSEAGASFFKGLIDEIHVANYRLTQAEIQTLMITPINSLTPPNPVNTLTVGAGMTLKKGADVTLKYGVTP